MQSSKKRLKLIQYFKGKIGSVGVLFLPETHSNSKKKPERERKAKDQIHFSHGKTNFYSVLTAYFGKENFNIKKQQTDKEATC